jgi:energy-coupling factor transporter ATP-binding protein EcfA2
MLQSPVLLASLRLKAATHFLRHFAPEGPWLLASAGLQRQFGPRSVTAMLEWIGRQQLAEHSVFVVPPSVGGTLVHIAVRAPIQARSADMAQPPSLAVAADKLTLIWRINDFPLKPAMAKRIAAQLAREIGGEAAAGQSFPLPGTIVFRHLGARLAQRIPVQMLSPLDRAYRVVAGALVAPPASRAHPIDPKAMAVPLGDDEDGAPAVWQPGVQSNGFMLILGASGSGKTETLKVIGSAIHKNGIPVLVLDFHGDVHLKGAPTTLLSSGAASTCGLNPLELDLESAQEAGLYDQRAALREMIVRAVPALGHRQADILHEALGEAYKSAGIFDDDPASWRREPPGFADLFAGLRDMADGGQRSADGVIAGVRDLFGHPIFNRSKRLSIEALLKTSARLDLSKLPDGVRFIAAETLLRRIFRALRMRGPIPVAPADDRERFRLFVIVDEAKILALGGNRERNILNDLFTEARKFGLGMVLASQMAEHFSEDVRSNAAAWLVLKPQAMAEAKRNAPNVGATAESLMALKGRGDGYYRVGNAAARRIQVRAVKSGGSDGAQV